MEEPSVLDYLKSLLNPFRREKIDLPKQGQEEVQSEPTGQRPTVPGVVVEAVFEPTAVVIPEEMPSPIPQPETLPGPFPWRALIALVIALAGQMMIEPPGRGYQGAIGAFIFCVLFLLWSVMSGEMDLPKPREENSQVAVAQLSSISLAIGAVLILLTFLLFGPNKEGRILFTAYNVAVWIAAILYFMLVLSRPNYRNTARLFWQRIKAFMRNPRIQITLKPWGVLMVALILIAAFFRFYQLDQIPGEMFSDHAEKLLDVGDVLNGQTSVFFERNTGREFFQMYLTAAVALLAGTGLTFMSLKIGTALAGFLTLPYIYLLAKLIGNRWVGVLAFLLAAVAYWPNLISRIGLRFPLYPLFVAPVLYYLIHGLIHQRRSSFVLAGFFLGLGLHGYSPYRLVPLVVVAAILIFILHTRSSQKRIQTLWWLVIIALVAFVVFLPLFRYSLHNPEMFWLRALSRSGTSEQVYPAPVLQIFFSNLWKAWIMPFWDNGGIWVHSVVGRPAMDVVGAVMYLIGTVLLVIRYVRRRYWVDLFLLVSVPLLMMPSILSLAFPTENPSLNRTGGAIIPVFIIAGLGMEAIFSHLYRSLRTWWPKAGVVVLVVGILAWTTLANYNLLFNKFKEQFFGGAWNTSDIGRVIRDFVELTGTPDTAYVVPVAHWVDTRLVGINAGFPNKDYALWPDRFSETLGETRAKLFFVKADDMQDLLTLRELYPQASYWMFRARYPGKDFWIFSVPAEPGEEVR